MCWAWMIASQYWKSSFGKCLFHSCDIIYLIYIFSYAGVLRKIMDKNIIYPASNWLCSLCKYLMRALTQFVRTYVIHSLVVLCEYNIHFRPHVADNRFSALINVVPCTTDHSARYQLSRLCERCLRAAHRQLVCGHWEAYAALRRNQRRLCKLYTQIRTGFATSSLSIL